MLCHLFKLEKEGQENLNQRVSIIDKFIWVMCSMQQQVSLLFLYQLRFAQTIFWNQHVSTSKHFAKNNNYIQK